MCTETDCTAEDSSSGVGEVDPGGAVHPHPRTRAAQFLYHRKPVAAGHGTTGLHVEGAEPDDGVSKLRPLQPRLFDAVAAQGFTVDRSEPLTGEGYPRQPGD